MNIPRQTGEIFEHLSKGQFICSNSSDPSIDKLFEVLDDKEKFEILYDYFYSINFILEKGDEFYYFSRKGEAKVDLERKLETACKWIDIVDFFKTFDNVFGSGYIFFPAQLSVQITVDAVLKSKADALKSILRMEEKAPYPEVVNKVIDTLCREGFAEMQNEILKSYKVLSSFKYLEELINNINIPEEIQNEIPE
jgi:hypothetical protein